jgi:hypothetical protein
VKYDISHERDNQYSSTKIACSGTLRCVLWQKLTDTLEVLSCSSLMTQTVIVCEMSISFYQTTRRNISKYSHLYTIRRKNLISHLHPSNLDRFRVTVDWITGVQTPSGTWECSPSASSQNSCCTYPASHACQWLLSRG